MQVKTLIASVATLGFGALAACGSNSPVEVIVKPGITAIDQGNVLACSSDLDNLQAGHRGLHDAQRRSPDRRVGPRARLAAFRVGALRPRRRPTRPRPRLRMPRPLRRRPPAPPLHRPTRRRSPAPRRWTSGSARSSTRSSRSRWPPTSRRPDRQRRARPTSSPSTWVPRSPVTTSSTAPSSPPPPPRE